MPSSSDLETQKILEKKPKKTKKKSKPTPAADHHAKDEGDDPQWAYQPPDGAVLLDHAVDVGAFEWDAVKEDEDFEIWLIRVPDTFKVKHLNGLEIDNPSSSSRTARIGGLTRKKTGSYDVWSIGVGDAGSDDEDEDAAGAEDLRGLTCLLPRKRKKGKLYVAPKKANRHIVVSARPSIATPPAPQPVVYQDPPRSSYPKDVLKHAFVPYGARSRQSRSEEDVSMVDRDEVETETAEDKPASVAAPPPSSSREKPAKTKEPKGKKRKGEGVSPKKSKKHKTDA